jgi:2'-5' RNA ligase
MSSPEPRQTPPEVQRLFFALWPSDALRQELKRHCKHLLRHGGGRPVAVENLHITLAFLGAVTAEQRACVEQAAAAIQLPRFTLVFDHAGHWPRPRVLWIAPREQPQAVVSLASALSTGSRGCGLVLDSRPFRAHLTLMRKVAKPPQELTLTPLTWEVDHFVLVRSQTHPEGVQYTPLRAWSLL